MNNAMTAEFRKFWIEDRGHESKSRQDRVMALIGGLIEVAFEEGWKAATMRAEVVARERDEASP